MYSPSSRAADISRLLDPSYSNNTPFTTHVYVDQHGDLHDPDYRDFPPVSHSPRRATRPRWESAGDNYDDDDDDDLPSPSYSPRSSPRTFHRPAYSTYSPTQSPPTSYESDATCFSAPDPFADDEKKCVVLKRAHRRHSRDERRQLKLAEVVEEKDAPDPTPLPLYADQWTPTCSQSLRRHWQAIALRFRFSVFRAQRKVRRRLSNR